MRKIKYWSLIMLSLMPMLNGCQNDERDIQIIPSDNYYSGIYSDDIKELDNISYLKSTDNAVYAIGSLSNIACETVIDIYDKTENSYRSVTLEIDNCSVVSAVYADDSAVYVGYIDGNSCSRAGKFEKTTGKKVNDVFLSDDFRVQSIFKDSSGHLFFHMINTGTIESLTKEYDNSLNFLNDKEISNNLHLKENEIPVKIISNDENGYYVLTLNFSNSFSPAVYSVSDKFEVKYCIDDFSDMDGEIKNLCINHDNNLLIIFKENNSNKYSINEVSCENGSIVERYECEFDNSTFFTGDLLNSSGQSSNKYDFYISKPDGIFGYDLKSEISEKIADSVSEGSNDCVYIKDDNIYIYNSKNDYRTFSICKIDENGSVADNEVFYTDKGYLGEVYIDKDENVYFIQITGDNGISVCSSEKQLCSFTYTENIEEICGLYIDDSGIIHVGCITYESDTEKYYLNYNVSDVAGKMLLDKKEEISSDICGVFPSDNDSTFKMVYADKNKKFTVISVDYKTGNEKKTVHGINIDNVDKIYCGYDNYDFCYAESESVYGYTDSEKKSEEIINWNNSQLYTDHDKVCLKPNGTIVCSTTDDDKSVNVCLLKKADKETIEKLKNRTVVDLVVLGESPVLRKAVNKFNNTSTECYIKIKEKNSISEFDKSVVSGEIPDAVIWDYDTDMSSFCRDDFFTDLNVFFEKDKNISSDDMLANINKACSASGKTEYYVLDFTAEALICDSSKFENDVLTYADLLQLNNGQNHIFYDMTAEELLDVLVYSNIGEYVDSEKKDCNFNTEKFLEILKFIKKDAVKEKFQIMSLSDFEKEDKRFDENKCLLQKVNLNESVLLKIRNNVLKEFLLLGFPTDDNMYSCLKPNTYIGITEESPKKDAAWKIVSYLLSEEYQDNLTGKDAVIFPVNKESFEKTRKSMYNDRNSDIIDKMFDYSKKECFDFISDKYIFQIVYEETNKFFNDDQSIDETVKIIDNKVRLYLNEVK